jgi:hypothetical protein
MVDSFRPHSVTAQNRQLSGGKQRSQKLHSEQESSPKGRGPGFAEEDDDEDLDYDDEDSDKEEDYEYESDDGLVGSQFDSAENQDKERDDGEADFDYESEASNGNDEPGSEFDEELLDLKALMIRATLSSGYLFTCSSVCSATTVISGRWQPSI